MYCLNYDYHIDFKLLEESRFAGYVNYLSISKSVFHDCYFLVVLMNNTY